VPTLTHPSYSEKVKMIRQPARPNNDTKNKINNNSNNITMINLRRRYSRIQIEKRIITNGANSTFEQTDQNTRKLAKHQVTMYRYRAVELHI